METITECKIEESIIDPSVTNVWVRYGEDEWNILFTFYQNETKFTADEFVGVTRKDALQLRKDRDHEYFTNPD